MQSGDLSRSPMARERHQQQDGLRFICGMPVDISLCSKDHLIPLSKHGATGWRNIVLTHAYCNIAKSDRLPDWDDILRFHRMTGHNPATTKRFSTAKVYRKFAAETED